MTPVTAKTPRPSKAEETRAYEIVTDRDMGQCVRCGGREGIQRDHIQNRQSGNTVVWNLQCLCLRCHQWKSENPIDAIAEGFALPRWIDVRDVPVRRLVFGQLLWVIYGAGSAYAVIGEHEAMSRRETLGIL